MRVNQLAWTQKLKAFSETQKKNIIQDLQKIVQNGIYGIDYTIDLREKNRRLRKKYCVSDEKIKEILLSLQIEDFTRIDDTDNVNHPGDIVCKFKRTYPLIPRWKEDAGYEDVSLYIKMVKPEVGEPLFIISFHEDE